jgi:hypothetical protein
MAFAINDIRGVLQYGGARPTLFEARVVGPQGLIPNFNFLCKGTSLPESDVSTFNVPYFGRQIKLAGNRTYRDWQVTVMNDEDFTVRDQFERWHSYINSIQTNLSAVSPTNYKTQANVIQYGKDGTVLRQYTFVGLFPVTVSGINLDWSDTDRIEEFNVTFSYDYHVIDGGTTGTLID